MAVERWKAADAAFGMLGFADVGIMRAPRDADLRHLLDLSALKKAWGIW